MQILVFRIDNRKYALDLETILHVLQAVQYTTIPNSPDYVLGAINIHGEIVPVINTRKLLNVESKSMDPKDHLILCTAHQQKVALLVDQVEQVTANTETIPHTNAIHCIMKEKEEITILCDLEKLIPEHSIIID